MTELVVECLHRLDRPARSEHDQQMQALVRDVLPLLDDDQLARVPDEATARVPQIRVSAPPLLT